MCFYLLDILTSFPLNSSTSHGLTAPAHSALFCYSTVMIDVFVFPIICLPSVLMHIAWCSPGFHLAQFHFPNCLTSPSKCSVYCKISRENRKIHQNENMFQTDQCQKYICDLLITCISSWSHLQTAPAWDFRKSENFIVSIYDYQLLLSLMHEYKYLKDYTWPHFMLI